MSEPSEWAMEKARKVIEIDGIPDHAPLLQRFARALDEVATNATTIKEMQAETEALREALRPLRELVQLADSIREAQRGYMADRGNGAKGAAVGAAAAAYDEARSAYEGEK